MDDRKGVKSVQYFVICCNIEMKCGAGISSEVVCTLMDERTGNKCAGVEKRNKGVQSNFKISVLLSGGLFLPCSWPLYRLNNPCLEIYFLP